MTDAKILDLRPCPFCGSTSTLQLWDGKDELQTTSIAETQLSGNRFSIICNVQLAGCGGESGVRTTPDRAIDAWNQRARPLRAVS